MSTKAEWKAWAADAGERAVKTAAQTYIAAYTAVAVVGDGGVDAASFFTTENVVAAAAGAGLSLLTSLASKTRGSSSTASVIKTG